MKVRTALVTALLFALAAVPVGASEGGDRYDATIRRTSHGIPHIVGDDFGDIGFGYGYAFAQDNLCAIAEEYVTVNGERSRFFGPDGTYEVEGNGFEFTNFNSDVYYRAIIATGHIRDLVDTPPPLGPVPAIKKGVHGYVAGYNAYLDEVGGRDGVPDPTCRGAEWVRPITADDAYHRFFSLGILASSGIALDGIAGAEPPRPGADGGAPAVAPNQAAELGRRLDGSGLGSNAYGLGADATTNGRGMVLGNPHFPWHGSERFYQAHLTIPGQVDVQGASLFGVPLVLIGHTRTMGWSHTVSTARRFTVFELQTVPGSPTTYLVDGEPREMERLEVTVPVRTDAGVEERPGDMYMTDYGPVVNSLAGLPIFPWTDATAFALGDVNFGNFRYLNHFFFTNQADSVRDLHEIETRYQGIPWVNTIAADATGEAYYADIGAIPHVTDDKMQECSTPVGQALWQAARVAVLDGRRGDCGWGSDEDAVVDGILGPGNEPFVFRDDYVTNSNDSYWLTNPERPLEGFPEIIGSERTARSLRTRLGLLLVIERLAGEDGLDGNRFDLERLQEVMFNNRQHAGELTRDAAVEMCRGFPGGTAPSSSGPTEVGGACDALASWDLRDDLDSAGAILFRRFWNHASGATPDPWTNDFDASQPVTTPNGLDTTNPEVQSALGDAINDLRDAGIPLDAPLRGFQSEQRGNESIPIHGGPGVLGVFNAINVDWLEDDAYRNVDHGSSFVMTVQFTEDCPDVGTILTYSQSTNPESPYWGDQTRMYADKEWVDTPFCDEEIAADPNLTVTRVSGRGDGGTAGAPDGGDARTDSDGGPLPTSGGGLVVAGVIGITIAVGLRRRGS